MIYSVSYFNLGGLVLCLGELSPTKPPVATGLSNLCITYVIAGNFDEIMTRSGLILWILKLKLRERKETNNS